MQPRGVEQDQFVLASEEATVIVEFERGLRNEGIDGPRQQAAVSRPPPARSVGVR
jgi:hypothetical protein